MAQVIDLPDELATLAGPACIIWNVNERAAFVVKLDRQTINGFRGALPIGLHAECGFYPDSAVIRLELSFHDRPSSPYVFDVFLNVMQPMHLSLLRLLKDQETIEIHFLGADNRHALTKSISYPSGTGMNYLLWWTRRSSITAIYHGWILRRRKRLCCATDHFEIGTQQGMRTLRLWCNDSRGCLVGHYQKQTCR